MDILAFILSGLDRASVHKPAVIIFHISNSSLAVDIAACILQATTV